MDKETDGTVTLTVEHYNQLKWIETEKIQALNEELIIQRAIVESKTYYKIGTFEKVYTDDEAVKKLVGILERKEGLLADYYNEIKQLKSRNLLQRIINKPV